MSFRYSLLCGTTFDAVDAVKLEIPQGFIFSKVKLAEFHIIIINFIIFCRTSLPLSVITAENGSGVATILNSVFKAKLNAMDKYTYFLIVLKLKYSYLLYPNKKKKKVPKK